jgi:hypothetical protein
LLSEFDGYEPSPGVPNQALARAEARAAAPAGRGWVPSERNATRAYVGYAAVAIGAIALIAVIALIASHPTSAGKPANGRFGIFAQTRGWITVGGSHIAAIDPEHPQHQRVLVHLGGMPLAWSRDGTKLLVVSGKGYVVVRADGSQTVVASPKKGGHLFGGSFTADGRRVIYSYGGALWSVPSTGGKPVALTRIPTKQVPYPYYLMAFASGGQVSPDGKLFVWSELPRGTANRWLIGVMNTEGRNRRVTTNYSRVVRAMGGDPKHTDINEIFQLAWFGDSSGYVLQADNQRLTKCAILAVNADGSNLRRWGPSGLCVGRGTLIPDGKLIALDGEINHHPSLILLDKAGHIVHTIQLPARTDVGTFAWQPGAVRLPPNDALG